jgi:streptogramin lyase
MRALALFLLVVVVFAAPASAKLRPIPREVAVVPTGRAPCGIAARAGSIWVGVYETGELLTVDDRDGSTEATRVLGRWACRVAVGPAAAWVTRDRAGELVRVWRGTRKLRRVKVGAGAFDVTLARGSAWVTSFETGIVARLDARSATLTRVYKDGPRPAGIASCGGSIWVGHGEGATWLTRIAPRSHHIRRADVVLDAPAWPRCVRGELWVTTADSVLQMNPRTGALVTHYRLGGTPAEAAAGPDGLVWVTDKERSVVHRIDGANRRVLDSFPAGPGAYALARAGDAMWVTSFAGADVRKFEP